jgi:hypothetical protein
VAIGIVKNGWLMVPYTGPELLAIEIGVGGSWTPAYLDSDNGQRIAMIKTMIPEGQTVAADIRTSTPLVDDGS